MIKPINTITNDLMKETLQNQHSCVEDFFYTKLKRIHRAEKNLVSNLPKTPQYSTFKELQKTFAEYLQVKQQQITKLEKLVQLMCQKPFSTL